MMQAPLRRPGVVTLTTAAFSQTADLVQAEFRLARAELAEKMASFRAGLVMMLIGAIFLIVALGMVLQALVSVLISAGLSPAVAILLVAGGAAVVGDPALDEPMRVSEALGEGGGALVNGLAGRLLTREVAEDGVDHAGGVRFVGGSAEFDALAEGGVGGDAIEVQELEGSKAEGDGYRLGEALFDAHFSAPRSFWVEVRVAARERRYAE